MIIDGKKMAEEIKESLKGEIVKSGKKLKLGIVQVGENSVSQKFIERKVKFSEEIGVKTKIYNLPAEITTNKLRKKMAEICKLVDGVIIQLPLPQHINTQYILGSIPQKKDVDVLSAKSIGDFVVGKQNVLPPVVRAIRKIFVKNNIEIVGKNVVIIGAGLLVGKPAMIWFINQGATVFVLRRLTQNIFKFTKEADIIITGVGNPGLIKPEMVKEGVIIIDAGTAMEKEKLSGDVDLSVASRASIFTPVPGGIGPLTVAMVFKNLLALNKK
ncbi:MAG: bifunctional 5,10-methylenetetrahydrofolate dehydrogenase/5,10-methenyltetrahydrofolate cyclohydrolase [Patescibacteria group bacterium]